jgi:hypothetical protein
MAKEIKPRMLYWTGEGSATDSMDPANWFPRTVPRDGDTIHVGLGDDRSHPPKSLPCIPSS